LPEVDTLTTVIDATNNKHKRPAADNYSTIIATGSLGEDCKTDKTTKRASLAAGLFGFIFTVRLYVYHASLNLLRQINYYYYLEITETLTNLRAPAMPC